ncbi:MAG: NAC domain-containing protein [Candidatus Heimdallarchaeota archaeon]
MKRAGRSKALKRAQQRKMKGLKEIPSARVVIFPEENDGNAIVIESPKVFQMRVEGQTMFQVVGDVNEVPAEEVGFISQPEEKEEVIEPIVMAEIRDEDVQLVAATAGVGLEEARQALEQSNGEPAKAILALRSMGQ